MKDIHTIVKANKDPGEMGGGHGGHESSNGAVVSRDSESQTGKTSSEQIKLKKSLGLFNGIAIIVGTIVGSGIFVSPSGVLIESGSVGLALVIWVTCGLICLLGAHSFAELGTMITKSGGMYAYIQEAFGDLAGFLYLWVALLIMFPAANAVIALTFGYYSLYPMFPCGAPDPAVRLLAALAITLLTFVNCASVKWAARVQDIFTIIKTLALVLIIVTGLVVIFRGDTENFQNAFEGSNTNPGNIALAFYSGLFSYSGWYTLNFLTEELKNPYKNLPRAIWISMPLVTIIYTLANVAYFAVISQRSIIESDAVAVTFAMKMYGVAGWIMPIFVAFSTFGGLNGCIMSVARMFFVGARQGHLPDSLALISVSRLTPLPAVLIQGTVSTLMLVTSDVFTLINYVTFVESLAFFVCTLGLIYFRYKWPDTPRPIKVWLGWPIIFAIVCLFLIAFPLYHNPSECGMGLIIMFSGVPVYLVGVKWRKPEYFKAQMVAFTKLVQKITMGVAQEGKED